MINYAHLKSQMIQLLDLLRSILYPNVFDAMEEAHSKEELETAARRQLREILERIYREPPQYDDVIDTLFSKLPAIRDTLDTDVQAAYEGDPAATCREEVMLAYPAFEAISIFRIAHELYLMKVPMLPRMMTEYAHSLTGIDIHPGAVIGPYFFIDNGTITWLPNNAGTADYTAKKENYTYRANGFYIEPAGGNGFRIITLNDYEMKIIKKQREGNGGAVREFYCVYRKMTPEELKLYMANS